MAKSVTVTIRITTSGDGLAHSDVFQFTNGASTDSIDVPMVPGNNVFSSLNALAVPNAGESITAFLVVPPKSSSNVPSSSGVSKNLIKQAGDTGMAMDPASPLFMVPGGAFGFKYGSAEGAWFVFV